MLQITSEYSQCGMNLSGPMSNNSTSREFNHKRFIRFNTNIIFPDGTFILSKY